MNAFDELEAERLRLDAPANALTRLIYIFGSPIAHVRAPVVWSTLMKRHGVNALMLPADVRSESFDAALQGVKHIDNTDGIIFTMPHKVVAMQHADALTERAHRIGSINLLRRRTDNTWEGDNVDGAGFVAGLHADGVVLEGAHVYMHGCGGVGRSIGWSVALEKVASLTLFDIDDARARELANAIAKESDARIECGTPDMRNIDIAINASPIGLHAHDALPFAVDALPPHATVADVIMEPRDTTLLRAAQAKGLKTHHGRNMMNYGMPIAASFFGLPASFDWNGASVQA
ncbi:shikimate 5-dehydrogenase [Burkholderia sp. SFA1]|uniref:shikimate dehydrogenase family protein n=1 Tax=Caballeronia sp. CLC5 TaxID=2906764 RepID=UPI001F262B87|nr:shikimate dehydrogenase [Caballeronia sp. CLC5]MCE4574838.1 shikimate dehydrogenase [Caballeronia sp. CLC5]BBQ00224.1 shikimate 5-dehydrogenase [Burkholderia sp. SFA1]